jgi:hypothetical protein
MRNPVRSTSEDPPQHTKINQDRARKLALRYIVTSRSFT